MHAFAVLKSGKYFHTYRNMQWVYKQVLVLLTRHGFSFIRAHIFHLNPEITETKGDFFVIQVL